MFRYLMGISFFVAVLLVGAPLTAYDHRSQAVLARLPMYESCETALNRYEKRQQHLGVNVIFEVDKFSTQPKAHPGLVGMLNVLGDGRRVSVDEVVNGLRILCMADANYTKTPMSNRGMQLALSDLRQKPKETYIVLEGEELVTYSNNANSRHIQQILGAEYFTDHSRHSSH